MAESKSTPAPTTDYVILHKPESNRGEGWREVGQVEARSKREAIKTGSVQRGTQLEGLVNAVPARSWHGAVLIRTTTEVVVQFDEPPMNGSTPPLPVASEPT